MLGRLALLALGAGRNHVGAVRVRLQMRGIDGQRLFYLDHARREVVAHPLEPAQLP